MLDATSPSLNSDDNIPNSEISYKSLTINYAKRLTQQKCVKGTSGGNSNANKWRNQSVTLYNNDKMIIKEWYDTLSRLLNGKEIKSSGTLQSH